MCTSPSLSLYIYIYIYVCMYVCMYVYIYIYIHIIFCFARRGPPTGGLATAAGAKRRGTAALSAG